jgi:glycosyltransferase involved in cell wall biosynthesis
MTHRENPPLVSVIIPFYNTPPSFMREAIESVIKQSYPHWELLLVDDGDAGPATELACSFAEQYPGRIYYFDHAGHANIGQSASRNVGITKAKGDYIAVLDSDDIWLPQKLETQVKILELNPSASMVYANTKYWYSWSGKSEDNKADFIPELGVDIERIYDPPYLLPLFLEGKAAVPCVNSLLIRKDSLIQVGGFEASFRTADEDQAFYAKMCLSTSIYVSGVCHDLYRQHSSSVTAVARQKGIVSETRIKYLKWLEQYLLEYQVTNREVWKALQREFWKVSLPAWFPEHKGLQKVARWGKKWALRGEERLLPRAVRNQLWK